MEYFTKMIWNSDFQSVSDTGNIGQTAASSSYLVVKALPSPEAGVLLLVQCTYHWKRVATNHRAQVIHRVIFGHCHKCCGSLPVLCQNCFALARRRSSRTWSSHLCHQNPWIKRHALPKARSGHRLRPVLLARPMLSLMYFLVFGSVWWVTLLKRRSIVWSWALDY